MPNETEITCAICGEKRMMETWLLNSYLRKGLTRFTCGKKPCCIALRSIRIREAKSTQAAKAKISATSKAMWAANRRAHAAACSQGMHNSLAYTSRSRFTKAAATRAEVVQSDPGRYSRATRQGWTSRPRQVITPVDFVCACCGVKVHRDLPPDKYTRFSSTALHFCSPQCGGAYKQAHTKLSTRPCAQCGATITRRKALLDYQERKGRTLFFCCNLHQRMYQDTHGKMRDTVPELVVKSFLLTESFCPDQLRVVPFRKPVLRQRWTIPDFSIGDVLIYVDGCVVHGCTTCGTPGFKNNKVKDPLITAELQALGYTVVRIWEHELKDPSGAWKQRILAALDTPR